MSLPKHFSNQKFFPLILFDGFCVFLAFFVALAFRFDGHVPATYLNSFIRVVPIVIFFYCTMNLSFGLYGHLWRYASAQEVSTIVGATTTSTALVLLAMLTTDTGRPLPLSVITLSGFFTAGAFTTIRYRQRLLTGIMSRLQRIVGRPDRQRVLIVGAGEAGQFLARQIRIHSQSHRYELVGFVDDNPAKLGMRVHGASILGNRADIPHLTAERNVGLIVIAIHNLAGPTLREILSLCLATRARVKMMPNFLGKMDSAEEMLPLKDITPTDLLGRQPHQVDEVACRNLIADKIVLVTGAAGSIGSELCRQILNWKPRQLLMLDNNETGLHDLALTFKHHQAFTPFNQPIVPLVADIRHQTKINYIFETYRPQLVFHAAAYKHVPLMEHQPDEAVRVNILGTKIVSEAAARYASERFVLISSDKAINPSSIMGATKRVAEMLITHTKTLDDPSSPAELSRKVHQETKPLRHLGMPRSSAYGRSEHPQMRTTLSENSLALTTLEAGTNGCGQTFVPQNGNGKNGSAKKKGIWPNGKQTAALIETLPPHAPNFQNQSHHPTLFTAVRFGNVLGSRGSVVPTFTRQIELGGPVTLTHPEMSRYFMTISEAVSLVIQAATLTEGDDIFMLDMGQEICIADLAHKMIRLRGLRPGQDIAIEYIGPRPGEKLHEELLAPFEERLTTRHPNIFRLRSVVPPCTSEFSKQIAGLLELSETQHHEKMVGVLWQIVQTNSESRVNGHRPSSVVHLNSPTAYSSV
jgi:FlaA1/EpsC-like NDP-sugar epimerase